MSKIQTIGTAVATLGDYRSRALLGDSPSTSEDSANGKGAEGEAPSAEQPPDPVVSPPPAEPSEALFAVAIAAGELASLSPAARQVLFLRNGSWSPPESDLHLTDRTA
jgi:hypothetical protein